MKDIDHNDKNYHVKELLIQVIENEISEIKNGYATADMKDFGSVEDVHEVLADAINKIDDDYIKELNAHGGLKAITVGDYIYVLPDNKSKTMIIRT